MRAKKGSKFERLICKRLSRWWTNGERDDIFWRSSQSGGRATQRMKKGIGTYGSYGDIAAVDPIGEPLLKLFTIELKRGSSYKTPGDMVDCDEINPKHSFAKCLIQARRSAKQAETPFWMMIAKRDQKCAMVYIPLQFLQAWKEVGANLEERRSILNNPCVSYKLILNGKRVSFLGITLDKFLAFASPLLIRHLHKALRLP